MPDDSTSVPASITPSPASNRADFDQRIANELTVSATLIGAALGSPEVLAQLSYTQAEIEEGQALHTAAQLAFNARQQAVGTARSSLAARDAVFAVVRDDFIAYRATVQANFPANLRTALGAGGRIPADLQKFVTIARSAYAAAQTAPYAETFAKRKLTGPILAERLVQVSEFETLDGHVKAADKSATAATTTRDAACATLRKWVGDFRKQTKADLRKFPELRATLAL